jgi:ABC-type phosphate/phosphonate transport system substrate-binding protein
VTSSQGIVVLGMYPFAHVEPATLGLWRAIRERLGVGPHDLASVELHASWRRTDLLLGQTCGWPLVTTLTDATVVGAFELTVAGAVGAGYRSVLVGFRRDAIDALVEQGPVAVNSYDSLSGWVSLCSALGHRPANVTLTGAHATSLRAVADGSCSLASIDAVTYELVAEADPDLVASVHVVGEGPLVPTLPLIVGSDFAALLPELRAAISDVMADPSLVPPLRSLRISGFQPLERRDYLPLLDLGRPLLH